MNVMRAIPLVVAAALLAQHARAADAGDAAYGRRLAENWCASCHIVSAGQPAPNKGAPAFAAIAQSSDFSAQRLAYLLLDPHPKMAKLALSRTAIDDIAAYIMSLKK